MIHGQDPYGLVGDSVSYNERRVWDRKFPCPGDTAAASGSRMLAEHLRNIDNVLRNFLCRARITLGDVVVGLLQLLRGRNGPPNFHLWRRPCASFVMRALTSEVSRVRPSLTALSPSLIKPA